MSARYPGQVAPSSRLSTRILLTCAAIGVATGLLSAVAGWVTLGVLSFIPVIYGFVLGVHVLPGIIAQELLRQPWVAIITHLLAALVASALAPQWLLQFLGTALLFGGIQEVVAALTRYRSWQPWRFFVSGLIIGALVAVVVFFAADLDVMPLWAQLAYLALAVLGPVAWTAAGLATGAALRRAGVARPVRG